MRKFWVLVSIPTVYHIDAETKEEAAHKAVEKFQNEYNTRLLKPIVHQVKEFDHDEYLADEICQGPDCVDEMNGRCVHTAYLKRKRA